MTTEKDIPFSELSIDPTYAIEIYGKPCQSPSTCRQNKRCDACSFRVKPMEYCINLPFAFRVIIPPPIYCKLQPAFTCRPITTLDLLMCYFGTIDYLNYLKQYDAPFYYGKRWSEEARESRVKFCEMWDEYIPKLKQLKPHADDLALVQQLESRIMHAWVFMDRINGNLNGVKLDKIIRERIDFMQSTRLLKWPGGGCAFHKYDTIKKEIDKVNSKRPHIGQRQQYNLLAFPPTVHSKIAVNVPDIVKPVVLDGEIQSLMEDIEEDYPAITRDDLKWLKVHVGSYLVIKGKDNRKERDALVVRAEELVDVHNTTKGTRSAQVKVFEWGEFFGRRRFQTAEELEEMPLTNGRIVLLNQEEEQNRNAYET